MIANTSNFFNVFMINHINNLSKKYDVFISCNGADNQKKNSNVSLIKINFKRGISFNDIFAFLSTLYFSLKIDQISQFRLQKSVLWWQ